MTMTTKRLLLIACLLLSCGLHAQQPADPATVTHYYFGDKRVELVAVPEDAAAAFRLLPDPRLERLETSSQELFAVYRQEGTRGDTFAWTAERTKIPATRKAVAPLVRTNAGQKLRVFRFPKSNLLAIEYPEVIVQFKTGVSQAGARDYLSKHYQVTMEATGVEEGQYLLRLLTPSHTLWLVEQLNFTHALVDYAEPNFRFARAGSTSGGPPEFPVWPPPAPTAQPDLPADPGFPLQWALWNRGDRPHAVKGADIHIIGAWKKQAHAQGIRVAVLDDAIDIDHPDLRNAIDRQAAFNATRMPSEHPDQFDLPSQADDLADHGTACAGIIAAAPNQFGVAGVAPQVTIVPVQVAVSGVLSVLSIIRGIAGAAKQHADVISFSMKFDSDDEMQFKSILAQIRKLSAGRNSRGIVFVAAAGNDDTETGGYQGLAFPASEGGSPDPAVSIIAVGASNWCDQLKDRNSCDGEHNWNTRLGNGLVLLAPGVSILTTSTTRDPDHSENPRNYRNNFGGTSAAAPFVAGVAALLLAAQPTLTAADVKKTLIKTADPVPGTNYRRLNACRALGGTNCDNPLVQ